MFPFVFDVQNRRKIVPWERLEAPRGPSRGLPEAVHRRFQSQLTMNERNERFWEFSGSSREAPGDPRGPQKFIENRFFAKKERSTRNCLSIFVHKDASRVLHDFNHH